MKIVLFEEVNLRARTMALVHMKWVCRSKDWHRQDNRIGLQQYSMIIHPFEHISIGVIVIIIRKMIYSPLAIFNPMLRDAPAPIFCELFKRRIRESLAAKGLQ